MTHEKCPFCKYIRIDEKRLESLLRSERKLQMLEAGGVDNWEWYSESLKGFFVDGDDLENEEEE